MAIIGDINTIYEDLISSAVSVLGTTILRFALNVQTLDGTSVDCKVEEADATDGPWTTVTGGTFTQVTSAPSSEVLTASLTKSLIRYVATLVGDEAEVHFIADGSRELLNEQLVIEGIPNYPGTLNATRKGALDLDNTPSDGVGLRVYSNHGVDADTNLAAVWADNPAFDENVFRVINDGIGRAVLIEQRNPAAGVGALQIIVDDDGGAAYSIRIDDPNPDIEFIETDQVSPAGKFEIAVQADQFQINGRNAADNSFETIIKWERVEDGATMIFPNGTQFNIGSAFAGTNGDVPAQTVKYLKIEDDTGTPLLIPCYAAS